MMTANAFFAPSALNRAEPLRRNTGSIQMIQTQISAQIPKTNAVRMALKKNMIGRKISNTPQSSTVPNS